MLTAFAYDVPASPANLPRTRGRALQHERSESSAYPVR